VIKWIPHDIPNIHHAFSENDVSTAMSSIEPCLLQYIIMSVFSIFQFYSNIIDFYYGIKSIINKSACKMARIEPLSYEYIARVQYFAGEKQKSITAELVRLNELVSSLMIAGDSIIIRDTLEQLGHYSAILKDIETYYIVVPTIFYLYEKLSHPNTPTDIAESSVNLTKLTDIYSKISAHITSCQFE
jgi:hypothetical protein